MFYFKGKDIDLVLVEIFWRLMICRCTLMRSNRCTFFYTKSDKNVLIFGLFKKTGRTRPDSSKMHNIQFPLSAFFFFFRFLIWHNKQEKFIVFSASFLNWLAILWCSVSP